MNTLITKSLESEDVHLLFGFPRDLLSGFEKKVVQWIVDYTARHAKPPTLDRLEEEFDTFVPKESDDPLTDIYDRTLKRKRNIFAREYMTTIQDDLKKGADPLPYIEKLHAVLAVGDGDVVRYSTYDRSAYFRRPTSFPYEIPQLDRYTGGMAQGDLIYLIGRLGTGKTTFALWILSKLLQKGRRVLMVSNENRADDVVAKIDSYIGGFNPIKKRTMEWTEDDKNRISTVSFIAAHMEGEVYIPNRPVQDTREVQSLIYSYQPDIVIVDGIYLMNGAGNGDHWEKITTISRNLKQIAKDNSLPIMGIHQASRNAVGKRIEVEHVAYSDALAQDADLLLAVNPEDDGSVFLESIKNRWGQKNFGFFLRFHFETMSVRILDEKMAVEEGDE